jgi:TolA-binding protein
VLERVEAQGVESCLRSCSAADLEALADAARYRGRSDLAERALQAQRRRFPGTELASTAAFLLGRAAEGRGDLGAAGRYYRSYLTESPRGPLALEALGRAMQLARRAGDREQARAHARELLGRGGSGVYAAQAREILSAP